MPGIHLQLLVDTFSDHLVPSLSQKIHPPLVTAGVADASRFLERRRDVVSKKFNVLADKGKAVKQKVISVSYTHLTLPTILRV